MLVLCVISNSDITEHEAITEPGDDEHYFITEHYKFIHKAYPLGMESGEFILSVLRYNVSKILMTLV